MFAVRRPRGRACAWVIVLGALLVGWPGPALAARPVIEHVKPAARVGQAIVIRATISADPGVFEAEVNWRPSGQSKFRPVPMTRDGRTWVARLPAQDAPGELEYFLVAISDGTYERATWADEKRPEKLRVVTAEPVRRKLSVTSTPDRAFVSIVADEPAAPAQGTTPFAVTLPPGGYTVTVSATGHVSQSIGIKLTADLPIDVRLQPSPVTEPVEPPPPAVVTPAPVDPKPVVVVVAPPPVDPAPVVAPPPPPPPEPTPPPKPPADDLAKRMAANAKLAQRDAAKGNASIAGVLGGGLLGVGAVLIVAGVLMSDETSVGEQSRTVALISGISLAAIGTGACGYSVWAFGQVPDPERKASLPGVGVSVAGRF